MNATTTVTVHEASEHLMDAIRHHFGTKDLAANDPLVVAIVDYGDKSRTHDDAGVHQASEQIYVALSHHFGPHDFGAHEPFVVALTAYGQACRAAGPKH
jgi:hypothetical protein